MAIHTTAVSQVQVIKLYDGKIPNAKPNTRSERVESTDMIRIFDVQEPTIEVYLPTKSIATGQAVLICPGGGYVTLAYDWEGRDFAKWFNSQGIAAMVLKYRLPSAETSIVPHETPLLDAKQAIRLIRKNASNWNIDTKKRWCNGFLSGWAFGFHVGYAFRYRDSARFHDIGLPGTFYADRYCT